MWCAASPEGDGARHDWEGLRCLIVGPPFPVEATASTTRTTGSVRSMLVVTSRSSSSNVGSMVRADMLLTFDPVSPAEFDIATVGVLLSDWL